MSRTFADRELRALVHWSFIFRFSGSGSNPPVPFWLGIIANGVHSPVIARRTGCSTRPRRAVATGIRAAGAPALGYDQPGRVGSLLGLDRVVHLPHHDRWSRVAGGEPIPGYAEPFEPGYIRAPAELSGCDKRSAKPIGNASEPGNGRGKGARRLSGADFPACSACQT